MTAVASQDVPGRQHQLARQLRAAVLGPRGGGTTRRRASDALRVATAIAVVAVSIPVMRANSAVELSIVHALTPPPAAIRWLVTSVFWLGSAGVIVLLVIVGLLVPRLVAVRWTALAGVLTWGACALLHVFLGPAAGRPPTAALSGVSTTYPVTQLAVTIAVGGGVRACTMLSSTAELARMTGMDTATTAMAMPTRKASDALRRVVPPPRGPSTVARSRRASGCCRPGTSWLTTAVMSHLPPRGQARYPGRPTDCCPRRAA